MARNQRQEAIVAAIEWRMSCEVNGERFQFDGGGHGEARTGTVEMAYEASCFPAGFDPVSCPLICNAPATMPFARKDDGNDTLLDIAGGQLSVEPARAGSIYDAKGKQVLSLSVSSEIMEENGNIVIGNKMKGFSRLPALAANITPVEEYIIPNGPGRAISTIRFRLQAKNGEMLTGMTTVPYSWLGGRILEMPLTRRYEMIDVRWDDKVNVTSTIRSALTPLVAHPASERLQQTGAAQILVAN